MITIAIIFTILFITTLALFVLRPDTPKTSAPPPNAKPRHAPQIESNAAAAKTRAPATEQNTIPETKDEYLPIPADYQSHEVARSLNENGYATLKELYFYPGEAKLRKESLGELAIVAGVVRDAAHDLYEIEGCSNGSASLAKKRAQTVILALVQNFGVQRERLRASGHAAGTSNNDRNRRVQVIRREN